MITDEIKITLLANEGLLIEHAGLKLLIDALHDKNKGGFSVVSKENLKKIINAEVPFDGVSHLIFYALPRGSFQRRHSFRVFAL